MQDQNCFADDRILDDLRLTFEEYIADSEREITVKELEEVIGLQLGDWFEAIELAGTDLKEFAADVKEVAESVVREGKAKSATLY